MKIYFKMSLKCKNSLKKEKIKGDRFLKNLSEEST